MNDIGIRGGGGLAAVFTTGTAGGGGATEAHDGGKASEADAGSLRTPGGASRSRAEPAHEVSWSTTDVWSHPLFRDSFRRGSSRSPLSWRGRKRCLWRRSRCLWSRPWRLRLRSRGAWIGSHSAAARSSTRAPCALPSLCRLCLRTSPERKCLRSERERDLFRVDSAACAAPPLSLSRRRIRPFSAGGDADAARRRRSRSLSRSLSRSRWLRSDRSRCRWRPCPRALRERSLLAPPLTTAALTHAALAPLAPPTEAAPLPRKATRL